MGVRLYDQWIPSFLSLHAKQLLPPVPIESPSNNGATSNPSGGSASSAQQQYTTQWKLVSETSALWSGDATAPNGGFGNGEGGEEDDEENDEAKRKKKKKAEKAAKAAAAAALAAGESNVDSSSLTGDFLSKLASSSSSEDSTLLLRLSKNSSASDLPAKERMDLKELLDDAAAAEKASRGTPLQQGGDSGRSTPALPPMKSRPSSAIGQHSGGAAASATADGEEKKSTTAGNGTPPTSTSAAAGTSSAAPAASATNTPSLASSTIVQAEAPPLSHPGEFHSLFDLDASGWKKRLSHSRAEMIWMAGQWEEMQRWREYGETGGGASAPGPSGSKTSVAALPPDLSDEYQFVALGGDPDDRSTLDELDSEVSLLVASLALEGFTMNQKITRPMQLFHRDQGQA